MKYNKDRNMISRHFPTCSLKVWMMACISAFLSVSCGTITEELPPCDNYIAFRYDYNMMFVDAFPSKVKRVDVYVFDDAGKFVTRFSDERTSFGEGYRMLCPLPVGKYRLVAWAGLYDRSYEFAETVSVPDELSVRMRRGANGVQDKELDALWHGEAEMTVTDAEQHTVTVDLVKDTNKFRIVVQGPTEIGLEQESVDFAITDNNGFLAADNSLLPDERITYKPYFKAGADLGEGEGGMDAVVAELNTLRLLDDGRKPRLLIRNQDGKELVNIDLIKYLLLTKMEGHDMPAQEYLDRQDEYAMIFFLNKDAQGSYAIIQIKVNGWIIRPQSGDF